MSANVKAEVVATMITVQLILNKNTVKSYLHQFCLFGFIDTDYFQRCEWTSQLLHQTEVVLIIPQPVAEYMSLVNKIHIKLQQERTKKYFILLLIQNIGTESH